MVEHVWNVMAHAQKPDLVFQGNGRVHLNRRGSQFSRLLAAEVCASAVVMVVMLDTPRSEVEWETTGYPLHSPVSPSLPLPCVTVCHQVSTELYMLRGWGFGRRNSRPLLEYYMHFVRNLEVLIHYSRKSPWDSNRFMLLSESRALQLYQRKPVEIIYTTIRGSLAFCMNKLCYIPNVFCTEKV